MIIKSSAASLISLPSSSSSSRRWWSEKNGNFVCEQLLVVSRKLLGSQCFDLTLPRRGHRMRQRCVSRLYEGFAEEPFDKSSILRPHGEEVEEEEEEFRGNKGCCAISVACPSESGYGPKDSILTSNFDFLEPMMLGIKPEPPNWPEREAILWASIEQKAKNFGLPLSLRMIKKKQQLEGSLKDLRGSTSCSVKKAFSSMVFIIVELQSYALHMREALCQEDLEAIIAKVQRELQFSYVWLFQRVFSRTPALMLYVMILLANFSVYSASHNVALAKSLLETACDCETATETTSMDGTIHNNQQQVITQEVSKFADQLMRGEEEIGLWENEPDDYVDYFKTDLFYQTALSHDPYNQLLLCNYAQFLQLVARNYDRAEECFKRAVQVEPPDAEVFCKYANFLWRVRNDLWGAEQSYGQAVTTEPGNTYYASTYANFLWSTGGEETCFPLSNSTLNINEDTYQ